MREGELHADDARRADSRRYSRRARRAAIMASVAFAIVAGRALVRQWLPGAPAQAAGLEAQLYLLRPAGRIELGDLDPVNQDERVVLEVRPTRDGFLYLLNEDRAGNVNVLFPDPGCTLANPVRHAGLLVLPGACAGKNPYYVYTTPSGGRDRLLLIESLEPIAFIESEAARLRSAGSRSSVAIAASDTRGRGELLRGLGIEQADAPATDQRAKTSVEPFHFLTRVARELQERDVHTWTREIATR